jgi:P-type Cu+ transporter
MYYATKPRRTLNLERTKNMIEKDYLITGMSCASCAAHAKKAVSKLDGVEYCDVNIATEKMNVRYSEDQVSVDTLRQTIEDAGYGLVDLTSNNRQDIVDGTSLATKEVELSIEGMTCSACSSGIERILKKKEGVLSISVNLTTNRGIVIYDPSKIKLIEIKNSISEAGYSANEVEGEKTRNIEEERREKEINVMRRKLIIASIFAIPIFYIGMSHMIPELRLPFLLSWTTTIFHWFLP